MRFFQFTALVAASMGLAQALVIPESSPATDISKRSTVDLERIVARNFLPICKKSMKVCDTCPSPKLTKGKKCVPGPNVKCPSPSSSTTTPVKCDPKKQKCPTTTTTKCDPKKDRNCKRAMEVAAAAHELAKREEFKLPMDAAKRFEWSDGDIVSTNGLSVCTVLAIWDKTQIIEAHMPPAKLKTGKKEGSTDPNDYHSTATILTTYLKYFTAVLKQKPLTADKGGYLLVSSSMDAADKKIITDWLAANGLAVTVKVYSVPAAPGGTLTFSRPATKPWPPTVSWVA